MDYKKKRFLFWIEESQRLQNQTLKNHEKDLESLFERLRNEISKKNRVLQEKLENLGLNYRNSLLQVRIWEYIFIQQIIFLII